MKQLQNGIYVPAIGERGWGEEVNQNFEVLDSLIKKALETDDKCQTMTGQIQANTNEINKVNNDLSDNLTLSTTNLQNQIDTLNNNTTALKNKVDSLADVYTKPEIDNMLSEEDTSLKAYTDAKISGLVNSAPETLDTLNELAHALGNDPNFATTIATQIGAIATQIGNKADANHTHDDRYYTESEINTKLSEKSDVNHTHSNYLTGITKVMVTSALGYTPPTSDTNTTYSAGSNLSLSGTTFNVSDTPSFTDITINGYKITID